MNKTKKLLVSLTSMALVASNALGITSCLGGGGKNLSTGDVEVVAYDGSKVNVSFYHSMGQALGTILDDCIASFNEMYPNITITETSFGDYPGVRDQIKTELSTMRAPSLAYCYPDHVSLYHLSNAVLPLDGFIESTLTVKAADGSESILGLTQEQKDDYVPFYYEEGRMFGDRDGDGVNEMYTLPMLKSTELLYYNKTYFQKNNLMSYVEDAEGNPISMTWEQMGTLCQTILDIEAAQEGGAKMNPCIPLGYDSEANWFITMAEQLDSGYTSNAEDNHFVFNNATNRQFVETFRDWYDKGYVTTKAIFGSYTSDLFTQSDLRDENTGKKKTRSFMSIGSSGGASNQCPDPDANKQYPFEVGVTMIPQANPENPKMISQGPSLCLFKKQNPQEVAAAWLFAKYLTTTVEYQARFSMQNGYTCAIQSVLSSPIYNEGFLQKANGNQYLQAACIDLTMQYKNYYYVSEAFNGSSQARDDMETLMKKCFQTPLGKDQTAAQLIESLFNDCYNTLHSKYDKNKK